MWIQCTYSTLRAVLKLCGHENASLSLYIWWSILQGTKETLW
jgi:hypothetical protein